MKHNQWAHECTEQLRMLVEDGITFAEIARRMGITKNAAIGKALRLELVGPRSRGPVKPEPLTTERRLAALDIFPGAGRCVYPIGHPHTAGFHFCGERSEPERSYCAHHHALTHTNAPTP